ncbi:hypothetical protein CEXT_253861 [Caerostris extrusa]|uniref:Ribosomal protein S14 n=1 Tax=Caerostris extrusa TaxID=172846 RepID=A0AAV4XE07_CAEEX|nr:hypothetical protein CEXT_253861 [Caerostris extrusa]
MKSKEPDKRQKKNSEDFFLKKLGAIFSPSLRQMQRAKKRRIQFFSRQRIFPTRTSNKGAVEIEVDPGRQKYGYKQERAACSKNRLILLAIPFSKDFRT